MVVRLEGDGVTPLMNAKTMSWGGGVRMTTLPSSSPITQYLEQKQSFSSTQDRNVFHGTIRNPSLHLKTSTSLWRHLNHGIAKDI